MSSDNLAPIPEKFSVTDQLKFSALGDRVLVLEDEFKTGYECASCNGKANITCSDCAGEGSRKIAGGPEKKCSQCDGKGTVRCPACEGKGGLLIAPQTAERRPATGRVVSVGQGKYDNNGNLIPNNVRVGDTVLYSNFAGYVVDLARAGQPITLRILHDSEILTLVEGHLTMTNLKGKSEIAQFNP